MFFKCTNCAFNIPFILMKKKMVIVLLLMRPETWYTVSYIYLVLMKSKSSISLLVLSCCHFSIYCSHVFHFFIGFYSLTISYIFFILGWIQYTCTIRLLNELTYIFRISGNLKVSFQMHMYMGFFSQHHKKSFSFVLTI